MTGMSFSILRLFRKDPRLYQIGVLSALLFYGIFFLRFDLKAPQVVLSLATVLLTQYACTVLFKLLASMLKAPSSRAYPFAFC
jgi:hypothetical protein